MPTDLQQHADPEEVERLVSGMMHALQAKEFRGADGLSAALTFAFRLSKALIQMSGAEQRQENMRAIVVSFRKTAALLEAEFMDMSKERIH